MRAIGKDDERRLFVNDGMGYAPHLQDRRRAPTPPPRDPSGINSILQHVGEDQGRVMELVDSSRKDDRLRISSSPSSVEYRRLSSNVFHVEDGADSDSSESSSSLSWRRSMESRNIHQDSSRRASPGVSSLGRDCSSVQRRRCSSYENVREEGGRGGGGYESGRSTPGFYPNKPPTPSRSTRLISVGSPDPTPPYRRPDNVTMHRSSPYSFHHHHHNTIPSPSVPNGCRSNRSGKSTPVMMFSSADRPEEGACGSSSRHGRASPWTESDGRLEGGFDGDSTDSDPVRLRPPSTCKAPRSHRGSLPGDCHAWHPRACSPCCGNIRFHWYGGGAQSNQGNCWNYCGGYPVYGSNGQIYDHEELQAKIIQLETEKESLLLQVNVLTEQVEAQNEKIVELESTLSTNKEHLSHSEAMLRQEMASRSSLENKKLDLMAQVSSFRLQLATAEQERLEFEERSKKLEGELVLTYACLAEKEADLATLKSKMSRNGTVIPLSDAGCEVDKLKSALSSVMAANDEKEKKIQELQVSLNRYKKLQELVFSGHSRRGSDGLPTLDPSNKANSVEDGFKEKNCSLESSYGERVVDKPPPVPRQAIRPSATSSPIPGDLQSSFSDDKNFSSPLLSPVKHSLSNTLPSSLCQRSSSSENVAPGSPQKTPPSRRHYETLPRQHDAEVVQQVFRQLQREKQGTEISNLSDSQKASHLTPEKSSQSFHNLRHPSLDTFRPIKPKASGASFGKGFFRLKSSKRSSSAPELASQDSDVAHDVPDSSKSPILCDRGASTPVTPLEAHEKPRGIKKIFGKLKRTGSENLDATEAEFKRGGIRATAGPRLGWAREMKNIHNENMPFSQWDSSMIADWFHNMGLGSYISECKKPVKNGDHLLKCTPSDLEKEFGIKNVFHRKKLLLALNEVKVKTDELSKAAGKLDYHWIIRWLDDIGLPQYKDVFFDSRIDGRVLHHLTVEDMFTLKVTNQLHHISIKRGIQVLRENNFGNHCLKRRSLPDDDLSPLEVSKWTNHRVMEWLRTVDLSEYAPNLRGSGVHGALMVYEPRFNADLLATMLNIPPNKTLLRRHLSTQFKQLVGSELMQRKRECEADQHYSPLSPSAKVKALRRGQFSLLRKRNKGEVDFEDLVCPLNISDKPVSPLSPSKVETKLTADSHSNTSPQHPAEGKNEAEQSPTKTDSSKPEKSLSDSLPDGKIFETLATTNV